jgi:hypothetical protein
LNCPGFSPAHQALPQVPQFAARPPQAAQTAHGSARPSRRGSVG